MQRARSPDRSRGSKPLPPRPGKPLVRAPPTQDRVSVDSRHASQAGHQQRMSAARKLVIAIDGPAGSGKSTIAARLAKKLGYVNLESGAMYRALALKALEQQRSAGRRRSAAPVGGQHRDRARAARRRQPRAAGWSRCFAAHSRGRCDRRGVARFRASAGARGDGGAPARVGSRTAAW